jgi:hypothetical protein
MGEYTSRIMPVPLSDGLFFQKPSIYTLCSSR